MAVCRPAVPWDVVIVGAGISGLVAAKWLREADSNLRVLCLEARKRVGGRLATCEVEVVCQQDTQQSHLFHVNLGGMYVHGTGCNPLLPLLASLQVPTKAIMEDSVWRSPNPCKLPVFHASSKGKPLSVDLVKGVLKAFQQDMALLSEAHGTESVATVQQAVDSLFQSRHADMPAVEADVLRWLFGLNAEWMGTPSSELDAHERFVVVDEEEHLAASSDDTVEHKGAGASLAELAKSNGFLDEMADDHTLPCWGDFRGPQYVVDHPRGFQLLAERLAEQVHVELDQRVTAIDYSGSDVTVKYGNTAEVRARAVVVTVPLGVLRLSVGTSVGTSATQQQPTAKQYSPGHDQKTDTSTIAFTPALRSDLIKGVQTLDVSKHCKVAMVFGSSAFLPKGAVQRETFAVAGVDEADFNMFHVLHPHNAAVPAAKHVHVVKHPATNKDPVYITHSAVRSERHVVECVGSSTGPIIVLGTAMGHVGAKMAMATDVEVQEHFLSILKSVFENVPQPVAVVVQRWTRDPFSAGGYVVDPIGTEYEDIACFSQTDGKLFFAGEHTDPDWLGSVYAAYRSGVRTAQSVVEHLRAATAKAKTHKPRPTKLSSL